MSVDQQAVLREFVNEAKEQIELLERHVLALETRPDDLALIRDLFRTAHTFKGNASIVGQTQIAEFAHAVEEILEHLRNGSLKSNTEITSMLLTSIDAFRAMVSEVSKGNFPNHPFKATVLKWIAERRASLPALGSVGASPAAAVAALVPEAAAEAPQKRTLRIAVEQLDKLLNLVQEIAISRGRVSNLLEQDGLAALYAARQAHRESEKLHSELQEQVLQARLEQIGGLFMQHERTVRDGALALGKKAQLTIHAGDLEIDTGLAAAIRDPLMHLVRNAVFHGLETPERRVALKKDPMGTVHLEARHDSGQMVLTVSDDGGGLDRAKIEATARAKGLLKKDEAIGERSLDFIFYPGFSTADKVTELAGRGVGLDVVKRDVEALGGRITVDSEPGQGCKFTLTLPLTLAIIDGFLVSAGQETYVIPIDRVVECVDLPVAERQGDRGVLNVRGQPVPYLRLTELHKAGAERAPRETVVVLQHGNTRAGVAVDQLLGSGQTVVKPLGRFLQGARGVSGAAVLGNGKVALILDVPSLFRSALNRAPTHPQ